MESRPWLTQIITMLMIWALLMHSVPEGWYYVTNGMTCFIYLIGMWIILCKVMDFLHWNFAPDGAQVIVDEKLRVEDMIKQAIQNYPDPEEETHEGNTISE